MKLAHISHTSISISETFIYDLLKSLNDEPDVDLISYSGSYHGGSASNPFKTIYTGFSTENSLKENIYFTLGKIIKNERKYNRIKFQQNYSKKTLEKLNWDGVDLAYVDYATSGILVMDLLSNKNIPFIVHVHGYDITARAKDFYYLKELKILFQKADAFITASNYMKRRLILLGCEENKIHVINYGIPHNDILPLSWNERIKYVPSIVFLGRLTDKKNPIALIHAFKIVKDRIPEARLSIIGNGPLYGEVKQTIDKLNLAGSVTLHGALPREQSFPILNKSWVYAQHSVTPPSGDAEGFAISLSEASLHELPVVSTIHNGITENVIDGITGFLVPEFDYEAMGEELIKLLKDVELAEKMGKAGRTHILNKCSPVKRLNKIKALFDMVINKKN